MLDSLKASSALATPWMWQILRGPDRGQALPFRQGNLGRISGLSDPTVSRLQLSIHAAGSHPLAVPLQETNPVYKLWKTPVGLWVKSRVRSRLRLRPSRRIRMGETVLKLIQKPSDLRLSPPPPRNPRDKRMWLFLALPLVLTSTMVSFLGWRLLWITAILALVATVFLVSRWRALPSLHQLWLASAITPPPSSTRENPCIRVYTGKRLRGRVLEMRGGDTVALTGPQAASQARWIISQALLYGQASFRNYQRPNTLKIQLHEADSTPPQFPPPAPLSGSREVTICVSSQVAPSWCARSFAASPRQSDCTPAWFNSILESLEAQPRRLELSQKTAQEILPSRVDLPGWMDLEPQEIRENWTNAAPGLRTYLGTCLPLRDDLATAQTRDWELDLLREGPHALVAGTTGSGKSELLMTWLLGLALGYSPAQLRMILVDYKGGATFGPLENLPHVHGVLTDLQPALTRRALESLEAFMRRREDTLARVRARDVAHYREITGETLPRVLIVVDEFRALASDHPEVLENLVRLATHGRSLGLHLILATQKPGGIVSGQILANANLRICLRVRQDSEAHEVLGGVLPAPIPPALPGRLYWEGHSAGFAQVAWCGSGETVGQLVQRISTAFQGWDTPPPQLWQPPLPALLPPAPAYPRSFALADLPREGRQEWIEAGNSVGVFGNPGSGRTCALRALARTRHPAGGGPVLVFSPRKTEFARVLEVNDASGDPPPPVPPGLEDGEVWLFEPKELWAADRIISRALEGQLSGASLVIDQVEALVDALELLYPGAGMKRVEALFGAAPGQGYRIFAGASLASGRSSWGNLCGQRLVLCPRDTVDLHSAGIDFAGPGQALSQLIPDCHTPGRGLWQDGRRVLTVQVRLEAASQYRVVTPAAAPGRPVGVDSWHLPGALVPSQLPQDEARVCVGWSSSLGGWLRLSSHRHWIVDDVSPMRGVIAQIKREYRRLGYRVWSYESLDFEHNQDPALVLVYNSGDNSGKLEELWEKLESNLDFDVTILELCSPAVLPRNFQQFSLRFANKQTKLVSIDSSIESRHRAANLLQTSVENIKKLQVSTGFDILYRSENDCGALRGPNAIVSHLTDI